MPSLVDDVFDWLDRAEQAREVAGQLTDPGAKEAVLQVADIFDRLARAAVARTAARERKSEEGTHGFSRPSLIPAESTPRREEQDGPAQGASHARGTREDHRTSRLAEKWATFGSA